MIELRWLGSRWRVSRRALLLAMVPGTLAAQDPQDSTFTLRGIVVDSAGRAIPGAEVSLLGLAGTVRAGMDGHFSIRGLEPGAFTLSVRRLGYAPMTLTVLLRSDVHPVRVTLGRFPFQLAAIRITAPRRLVMTDPRMEEFNLRRARGGGGTFMTREEIARLHPRQMTDLLLHAPGFRAIRDRRNNLRVATRGGNGTCKLKFFIDGMGVELIDNNLDLAVRVQDVEAIEFYRGVSTAPAQFSGLDLRGDAACGVIVVWTRLR